MKSLLDQITALLCPKHGSPYGFINKGDIQNKESRMKCDECLNPQNTNGIISIRKAFKFLEEQQSQEDVTFQQISSLRQQFQRNQEQIIQLLKFLGDQMEKLFNSIIENEVIRTLRDKYLNKISTIEDVESLGQYLSKAIQQDYQGQYKLQQVESQRQKGFLQCNEILKVGESALEILGRPISLISDIIEQKQCNDKQQQQQEILDCTNYTYELSQTIQLKQFCFWLCFNNDDTQIVAASNKCVLIFNLSIQGIWVKGEFPLIEHKKQITKVKFNHDSTQIASCSLDKTIIIWEKQPDGKWSILDILKTHNSKVYSVCFNHDSKLLASGSSDETIQIHAYKNGKWKTVQQLADYNKQVSDVCFNHDSTLLASGSHLIILWQLNCQGQWVFQQKINAHILPIHRLTFNSDSKMLVSTSNDKSIKIWEVDEYGVWKSNQTLNEHCDRVKSIAINKQSNMIITSSLDKTIKIWKIGKQQKWECIQTMNENQFEYCSTVSSDSTFIISGSTNAIKIHRRKLIQ